MPTKYEIRRWTDEYVEGSDGYFYTENIWRAKNIITRDGKDTVWHRLDELVDAKKVEKSGLRYRRIDEDVEDIDIFQEVTFASIKFPFQLEDYIRLSEGGVMVIGGEKDAGKTAILLKIAIMNADDCEVWFWNSETGVALLKERILAMKPDIDNPLPFHLKGRIDNFADVIKPDAVNIIDYLDMDAETYMVGAEIKKIVKALNKGVAIIGLQKPPGRDLPIGGIWGLKKAEVYVAMQKNLIKIVNAKSRANPKVNPVNKQWTFWLDNKGANFLNELPSETPASKELELPF